jgi:hypothetical protein
MGAQLSGKPSGHFKLGNFQNAYFYTARPLPASPPQGWSSCYAVLCGRTFTQTLKLVHYHDNDTYTLYSFSHHTYAHTIYIPLQQQGGCSARLD